LIAAIVNQVLGHNTGGAVLAFPILGAFAA
jgi:hypothetical protein